MKAIKDRFKIQTFFEEGMQLRLIHVFDRLLGKSFVFHMDEVELINNSKLHPLKKHLQKRMHFIRAGAYDVE
ncbi:hypothetical protein MUN88_20375 [Gracilibacillus caseinilyticus]|uniref:Uncharacterized protein n=1 Tax=Gracilibacillus caseinilyticus TaxID=2932256 RepID=A0ABY4EWY1_9BACI|nr:hypothetical protein [Gracilibacillus caseinilyticus]UOQ48362.1 hypothetical protein MUN88_20375 [Gracilibacillus caseinilyticus]